MKGRDFLRRLRLFVELGTLCGELLGDDALCGGSSTLISKELCGELGVDGVLRETSTISFEGSLSLGLGGSGNAV